MSGPLRRVEQGEGLQDGFVLPASEGLPPVWSQEHGNAAAIEHMEAQRVRDAEACGWDETSPAIARDDRSAPQWAATLQHQLMIKSEAYFRSLGHGVDAFEALSVLEDLPTFEEALIQAAIEAAFKAAIGGVAGGLAMRLVSGLPDDLVWRTVAKVLEDGLKTGLKSAVGAAWSGVASGLDQEGYDRVMFASHVRNGLNVAGSAAATTVAQCATDAVVPAGPDSAVVAAAAEPPDGSALLDAQLAFTAQLAAQWHQMVQSAQTGASPDAPLPDHALLVVDALYDGGMRMFPERVVAEGAPAAYRQLWSSRPLGDLAVPLQVHVRQQDAFMVLHVAADGTVRIEQAAPDVKARLAAALLGGGPTSRSHPLYADLDGNASEGAQLVVRSLLRCSPSSQGLVVEDA